MATTMYGGSLSDAKYNGRTESDYVYKSHALLLEDGVGNAAMIVLKNVRFNGKHSGEDDWSLGGWALYSGSFLSI